MKCCISTDIGTWTNWLTFEPNLDQSPDAGTGLLSLILYKHCYVEFYVGENPISGAPLQRAVVLEWFYSLLCRNTFVGGTCTLPSALLVLIKRISLLITLHSSWFKVFCFYCNWNYYTERSSTDFLVNRSMMCMPRRCDVIHGMYLSHW